MDKIPILAFIGYSGSGKTSSILSIMEYLRSKTQYKIYLLKYVHQHPVDTPGKDSFKFSEAGAEGVLTQSDEQTAIYLNKVLNLNEILDWLKSQRKEPQFLITESVRTLDLDKILCASKKEEIDDQLDPNVKVITGKIALAFNNENYKGIPIINALEEPEKILKVLLPNLSTN